MHRDFILEICLDSAESAITAEQAGADRVELCANLTEGGTTPSLGMITTTRQSINIPLHVIIRPRGGDFCYSDTEFEVMKADVIAAKQAKADGIVVGILNPDGTVDIERTRLLVDIARPMSVTFHRAFDLTIDPFEALEDIIKTGANRILTSGKEKTAVEGIPLLMSLIKKAKDSIIIMPGAGLNETNLATFLSETGAKEVHMTANKIVEGKMLHRPTRLNMSSSKTYSEYELSRTDFDKVKHIREARIQ
jgi:copper homeostasis protein